MAEDIEGNAMATVNIGVIGLGRIGRINSRYLLRHPKGARLAAVSARRPEDAKKFLDSGDNIRIYTDYHDLLADAAAGAGDERPFA